MNNKNPETGNIELNYPNNEEYTATLSLINNNISKNFWKNPNKLPKEINSLSETTYL